MSGKDNGYLDMELLRFTTAGSVDDGKSTLIGRLLYDSKAIFEDQMEALELAQKRSGEEDINLAYLTDGLRSEREQGITIDVAYRYFATPKRKFIIADTPGHIQYTRNMVTGASTANAALILIDARHGVIEQTKRHAYIASLLQIPNIIVCVNKMDLVDFSQEAFDKIIVDFNKVKETLQIENVVAVPLSAKLGDNVVHKSDNTPWYDGMPLINILESIPLNHIYEEEKGRFPVQYVIRPQNDKFHDYRGFSGQIASGLFKKGEDVIVLPGNIKTQIKDICLGEQELEFACEKQSVSMQLTDDIDAGRGAMIVPANHIPRSDKQIFANICWLNEAPLRNGGMYLLKHTNSIVKCKVASVEHKVNINTLEKNLEDKQISLNDIASLTLKLAQPIFYDSYKECRITGSFILIDEASNDTVAAGMII